MIAAALDRPYILSLLRRGLVLWLLLRGLVSFSAVLLGLGVCFAPLGSLLVAVGALVAVTRCRRSSTWPTTSSG
jgi:hypothetical protein